jgi:hypothetical protein
MLPAGRSTPPAQQTPSGMIVFEARGVWTQPVAELHVLVVHGLSSLQVIAGKAQPPATVHVFSVQASLSSQISDWLWQYPSRQE